MIRYPNGSSYKKSIIKETKKSIKSSNKNSANRGMLFESEINSSNEYYLAKNICLIYKRPTPINVVKVDYSKGALITCAYFEKQSTTDYNGVYKGRYIDFEAKSTKIKTSFPLNNITSHQVEHLLNVKTHGGIAFFLVNFFTINLTFLIDADIIIDYYKHSKRRSIPLEVFQKEGILIEEKLSPRIDYIKAVDIKYFS